VYPDLVAVFRHRSAREAAEPVRVGFTVSKKVGNAVTRNRVKRQLREAVRHRLHQLTALGRPVDVVFIARSGAANAPSARLHAQVDAAFARIGDWTNRPTGRTSGSRR
jgi:ribonuclease P protein component